MPTQEIRQVGVANAVTAATRSSDVKLLLATPPGVKDEIIDPEELMFPIKVDADLTVASGAVTITETPALGAKLFGGTSGGQVIYEGMHFTRLGSTITFLASSNIVDGDVVFFVYPVNTKASTPIRSATVLDSGTVIDRDAYAYVKITDTNAAIAFTSSGTTYPYFVVKNAKTLNSITVDSLSISVGETKTIVDPGTGKEFF